MLKNKASLFYFALLLISILAFQCESDIPQGGVVLTLEQYDSLRAGAIIKEVHVPISPDYDSVNNFWQGKLTSELSLLEKEIDSLANLPPIVEYRDTGSVVYVDTGSISYRDTCISKPIILEPNIELSVKEVKVDTTGSTGMSPNYLFDKKPFVDLDNRGTRWGAKGYPHWAVFNFDSVVYVDSIYINTYSWNNHYTHFITVFNFADSIANFETAEVMYSGHYIGITTSQLVLRVDGGNNNWTDIGEIILRGKKRGWNK